LSEQALDSPGFLTDCNLDHDGSATDTDSEKESLHKVFDNMFKVQRLHKQRHNQPLIYSLHNLKGRRGNDRPTASNSGTSGAIPLVTSPTAHGVAQEADDHNSSTAVNASLVNPSTPEYDHMSCYEYPNGDIVETLHVLPEDQEFRAKSTGWACLHLQSSKALVRRDCEVKVNQRRGQLKADCKTYQTVSVTKRKALTEAPIVEGSLERVDIVEKLCLGVYRCPYCHFVERPRSPLVGKNRNSVPRPAVQRCPIHKCEPVWNRCRAFMISLYYHSRMKAVVHHRGTHNHAKPPPVRADARRALRDRS